MLLEKITRSAELASTRAERFGAIKRVASALLAVMEQRRKSEPPDPIAFAQLLGFRSFRTLTSVNLAPVNLLIGRNNSGKTNLLESFRFLSVESLKDYLVENVENFQSSSGDYLDIFCSGGQNHYYPDPASFAWISQGGKLLQVMMLLRTPYIFIYYFVDRRPICTVVVTRNLTKTKFIWGSIAKRVDGRTVRTKFDSPSTSDEFNKLAAAIGFPRVVAFRHAARDDKVLINRLESRLQSELPKGRVDHFLADVCHFFSIPSLTKGSTIKFVDGPLVLRTGEREDWDERAQTLRELAALARTYRRGAKRRAEVDKVIRHIEGEIAAIPLQGPRRREWDGFGGA